MRLYPAIALLTLFTCFPSAADDLTLLIPFNPVQGSEAQSDQLTQKLFDELISIDILKFISLDASNRYIEEEYGSRYDCVSRDCIEEVARWMSGRYIVSGTLVPTDSGFDIDILLEDLQSELVLKRLTGAGIQDMDAFGAAAAKVLSGVEIASSQGAGSTEYFTEIFIETPVSGATIYINGVPRGSSPDTFGQIPEGFIVFEAVYRNQYGMVLADTRIAGGQISIQMVNVEDIAAPLSGNLSPGLRQYPVVEGVIRMEASHHLPPGIPFDEITDSSADGFLQFRVNDDSKVIVESADQRRVLFGSGTISLPAGSYIASMFKKNEYLYQVASEVKTGETTVVDGYLAAEQSAVLEQLKTKIAVTERNLSYGYVITEADWSDLNAISEQASKLEGLDDISRKAVQDLVRQAAVIRSQYILSRELADLSAEKAAVEARLMMAQDARTGRKKASNLSLIIALSSGALSVGTWFLGDWAYENYQNAVQLDDLRVWKNRTELFDSATLGLWGVGVAGIGTFAVLRVSNPEVKQLQEELLAVDQEIEALQEKAQVNSEISTEN